RANEDSHAVDAVHVQHFTEIAPDDASFGADFLDGADCFHGIGNGLIQTGYHRPAGSKFDAVFGARQKSALSSVCSRSLFMSRLGYFSQVPKRRSIKFHLIR